MQPIKGVPKSEPKEVPTAREKALQFAKQLKPIIPRKPKQSLPELEEEDESDELLQYELRNQQLREKI